MRLDMAVWLESPAVISTRRATGNVLDTASHIPGTTLRGALAAAYLERGGSSGDAAFKELFLGGVTRFGDFGFEGTLATPLSVRVCRADEGHPVIDLLLGRGARRRLPLECSFGDCGAKLAAPPGRLEIDANDIRFRNPATRRVAHVQIDPESGRAMGGQFHTSRALEGSQRFEGSVWTSEAGAAALRAHVGATPVVWVGRGRTRGQGRLTLSVVREVEDDNAQGVAQRLVEFQRMAQELHDEFRGQLVFAVTMLSPAVLLDKWLSSRALLLAGDLGEELDGYDVLACFSRLTRVSGWHEKAGLPKADTDAVAAGSCTLFGRSVADVEIEAQRIAPRLAACLRAGVGELTAEGFGAIAIDLAVHADYGVDAAAQVEEP